MALVGEIVATRQIAIGDMAASAYCRVAVYDDADPRKEIVGSTEIEIRQEEFLKLHAGRAERDEVVKETVALKSKQVLDQDFVPGEPAEGLIGMVIPVPDNAKVK